MNNENNSTNNDDLKKIDVTKVNYKNVKEEDIENIDDVNTVNVSEHSPYRESISMQNDRINVLKAKQGAISSDQIEIFSSGEKVLPITGEQKWDNFWYHYKIHVFAIAFAIILLSMFIIPNLFAPKYDNNLLIVAEIPLAHEEDNFEKIFNKYTEDFDKNNNIRTQVQILQLIHSNSTESFNPQMQVVDDTKLYGDISTYNSIMMIVDEMNYEYLKNDFSIKFKDLTQIDKDNPNIIKDRYKIGGSSFSKEFTDYNLLLDELYLVILDYDSLSEKYKNDNEFTERYNNTLKVMENIITK